MKNKVSLLGLIGLLGLLGLFFDNPSILGFFGFFGFFGYSRTLNDDLFKENNSKAGLRAFYAGVLVFMAVTVASFFFDRITVFAYGFSIYFGVQIFVYSVSLAIFERKMK